MRRSSSVFSAWVCVLALSMTAGCIHKRHKPQPKKETPVTVKPVAPAPSTVKSVPLQIEEKSLPLPTPSLDNEPTWSYSGEKGPTFWSLLDPLFAQCGHGQQQSPINLVWHQPAKAKAGLTFMYHDTALNIEDNGHTIQINFDPGSKASIRGQIYDLKYMEFHTSSEHTLSGTELPMELEFYHQNKDGKVAVVSVFAIEGRKNALLQKIWDNIPTTKSHMVHNSLVRFNPMEFIPARLTYYHYEGSLTHPPCTEGIDWNVLNTPITASADQILQFRHIYSSNRRPVQPINGRKVVNY